MLGVDPAANYRTKRKGTSVMKGKKLAVFLLALLMILPLALAGCSGNSVQTETGTKSDVNQNDVYDAEIKDLGGHEFYFLTRSTPHPHLQVNEIFAEELNGDRVNDAVYQRNSDLEQTFNCKIVQDTNPDPAKAVKEQLIAGEYQYDYIYAGVAHLRTLASSNLLVDFNSLDNVHLEKSWWDMNAIQGFTIAGKSFYVTGAGGTMDERASWAIYFNKDVIERADLESPYNLVREGKWTVDKMYEYMMATKEDLDGDGVYTIGKDRFGYIGEPLNNWMHVAACNCRVSRFNEDGEIELPATVNKDIMTAWAALKPLLTSEYRNVTDSGAFSSGKGTFYGCLSAVIFNISKNDITWGVLPMPKLNEEQEEYWTSINGGWCYCYVIPTTTDQAPDAEANGFASGREQAGYFLEAFFAKSVDTLEVAFYEQVVKFQVVKDSQSAEMMEIALKNKVYDPVVIFNFGQIGSSLFSAAGSDGGRADGKGTAVKGSDVNYDTLVSLYESRLSAARKQLQKYVDYISTDEQA